MAMLPPPPSIDTPRAARTLPAETIEWTPTDRIWRIHRTTGDHLLRWSGLRTFGPTLRFDHQPVPRGTHPDSGIWYGTSTPRGALAEAFQSSPVIDRHRDDPHLTGLTFTRPLRLLDMSGIGGGTWATRVGGNYSLDSVSHGRAPRWARTIHRADQHPDGIIYRGRFAGSTSVALFECSADAFPTQPGVPTPLAHAALTDAVDTAAHTLGYLVT